MGEHAFVAESYTICSVILFIKVLREKSDV